MANVAKLVDLVSLLKTETPSFDIEGVMFTCPNPEVAMISFGDLDQNCICMEFISSEFVTNKDLKKLTHTIIENIKELIKTELFLIFATHRFGDRIQLYVDLKNTVKDAMDDKYSDGKNCENTQKLQPRNDTALALDEEFNGLNLSPGDIEVFDTMDKSEKPFDKKYQPEDDVPVAIDETYNELKLKLRDNTVFERVRDYLWYSTKPFSYPDFLWNGSYLNLRIQIGVDGFNSEEHALKELYVDFCSDFGCTRDDIDKDFSLRWKTKALDDIIRLNRDYEAAKYEKFREFIDAQIKTLENTFMYT